MLDWFLREERFSAISAFVLNVCNSNNSGRLFEVPISVLLLFARLGGKYLFQLRVALEPWCFECFWILLIGVTKVSLTLSFSLKPHTLSHSLFVFFLSHVHCVSFSLSLSLSLSHTHTLILSTDPAAISQCNMTGGKFDGSIKKAGLTAAATTSAVASVGPRPQET